MKKKITVNVIESNEEASKADKKNMENELKYCRKIAMLNNLLDSGVMSIGDYETVKNYIGKIHGKMATL